MRANGDSDDMRNKAHEVQKVQHETPTSSDEQNLPTSAKRVRINKLFFTGQISVNEHADRSHALFMDEMGRLNATLPAALQLETPPLPEHKTSADRSGSDSTQSSTSSTTDEPHT